MTNKTSRKLKLGKETLRTLGNRELAAVAGGGWLGQLYYWLTGTCNCGSDNTEGGNSGGVR